MSGYWQLLGFRQNPYFTTPIGLTESDQQLFVGRANEVRRMMNKWSADADGCITVIGGHVGTGKTSFLNVCQYMSLTGVPDFELPYTPPLIMPCFTKVQLETNQNERDLLFRMLRSAIESVEKTCEYHSDTPAERIAELRGWLDSVISSSSSGWNVGAGVGHHVGLMANGQLGNTSAQTLRDLDGISTDSLIDRITEVAALASQVRDYRGIIVALDNLEMIDSELVIQILNRYRDTLFSVPNIWWVLIGQKGLYDTIAADAARVAQRIKGMETTLEGLSWDDFLFAIQLRIDAFKERDNAIAPINEGLLRKLYNASSGEIRYVFKTADQIISDAIAENPKIDNVPPEEAENLLRNSVDEQIGRLGLDGRARRVIRLIYENQSVRPKDYKEYGFQNAPNLIQQVLQPLQDKGLVSKSTQGNAAIYSLRPPAILACEFELV